MPNRGAVNQSLFQSTLPQGERLVCFCIIVTHFIISIHAPARGATGIAKYINVLHNHFNPRSRKGSDSGKVTANSLASHFNPRSRKGSDILISLYQRRIDIFQSTLPQGERHVSQDGSGINSIFQSTLPQGERLTVIPITLATPVFQSTLPQGERLQFRPPRLLLYQISIHAPARGATRGLFMRFMTLLYFNPRSRKGSDFACS